MSGQTEATNLPVARIRVAQTGFKVEWGPFITHYFPTYSEALDFATGLVQTDRARVVINHVPGERS